ncbi:NEW3 domain-containing protein [Rudaeicoccus suwonensis]|uniref:Alpha-galactosidase n=1 Tax=Rudaeicoccus suwonensis TaxID=657409 RepID=A0A561E370_9MICO|nr:NEW3 domain-containing protein [Rudaeicoccus suwonensis]TWE10041.1 alpha-galactosidase-like protein [Rudaeicoccus suwonensis]
MRQISTAVQHRRGWRRSIGALVTTTLVGSVTVMAQFAMAAPPAHALDNGLAALPQMGWNDWNAFGCNVSAQLIEQTADRMVADGMKAAGYDYVNIDDCWMEKSRDAQGNLVPDPTKFPQGIKAVADYVHSKGLKLGIYEDAGTATCAGYPGSLGHEQQDADSFASWGVDYLKYDNCNNAGSSTTQQYIDRYIAMRDALANTTPKRKIFYSLCEWGVNDPWTWGPQVGNSWRTTGDINDSWGSMMSNFQQNVNLYPYAKPGGWNDPDMLEVGNGGQTTTEYQSEFSLWAMMNAPLISGTDLRTISAADLAIYTNKKVIALDQDSLAKQAIPVPIGGEPAGNNGLWVLEKPLSNGDTAVALFNSNGTAQTMSATSAELSLGNGKKFTLDNLWSNKTTQTGTTISATVPAHGTVLYRVKKGSQASVAPSTVVSMNGTPAAAQPGQSYTATATLTNNAKVKLTTATLKLKVPAGWKASATSATTFNNIRAGGSVSATFSVTVGSASTPIESDTTTAVAQYAWSGGITSNSSDAQVQLVSPVQSPNLTFSSASDVPAVYGQSGDDFAVSGGGTDLWGSDDNYSTIYRKGAVSTDSTITTTVASVANLSGYGKTGILVRNDITAAGTGPEGVILFTSPSGGIQLEWASGGSTQISQVTPANGTIPNTVPVELKLVRNGQSYTGYYSTNNGSTWTTVGTATLSGQAATQDAGLFVTSHDPGSPATTQFNGFNVS